jgi:hypothetical protein
MSRSKARVIILAVFLLGAVAGGLSMNLYERLTGSANRPGQWGKDGLLKKLNDRLHLTPEQFEQVRTIVNETDEEYSEIRRAVGPRFDAVRQKSREQIRALLTKEQSEEFDRMIVEADQRRQKYRENKMKNEQK